MPGLHAVLPPPPVSMKHSLTFCHARAKSVAVCCHSQKHAYVPYPLAHVPDTLQSRKVQAKVFG